MKYSTGELSGITGAHVIGDKNVVVETIEFDSRSIYSSANTAFIAISTKHNTGQKFISSAIEKGVKIIISECQSENIPHVTWLIVEDSIAFLQKLASFHLKRFHLKSIGITGSNGKSIVKEWLYQSVQSSFKTVKSPKSYNSQIGLPLSILQTEDFHELGIFEVGISQPGEMQKLSEIFSPQIGVLTHIGTAHSANFESESQLISEKIKLFKNSHTIIFNGDHAEVRTQIKSLYADRILISYGFHVNNDVFIQEIPQNPAHEIEVTVRGAKWSFPAKQRDEATISNVLSIITLLTVLGFEKEEIIHKINQLRAVEMRLESLDGLRNNLLINDSYNLDLDSLKIAFQFIKQYNKPAKTLIITDFLEAKDADVYKKVEQMVNFQGFKKVFAVGQEISQLNFTAETFRFDSTAELLESPALRQLEDELILLKGARRFELEKVKNLLELQKHDTILEVNLNSILHNINIHKNLLRPETKMMAMVKAYSYGLGGYEIAEFLQHHHIDYLGVAYADEGSNLRKKGITTPIMVMNPEQHSYGSIIEYNLEPEIYSLRVLRLFNEKLLEHGVQIRYPVHLKIETGMHRLGFSEKDLDEVLLELKRMNVEVKSVFTHLSSADDLSEGHFTVHQVGIFNRMYTRLCADLGYHPVRHILNSSGIANYSEYQYEMVRIGIGMVGISTNEKIQKQLKPAVSFKTVISQISEVDTEESVGYNRRHRVHTKSLIATIPVGYADGIPRSMGNGKGFVGLRGKLVPIVGSVCMDMLMLDITGENVVEGEEITIFNSHPTLSEFSQYCNTIPYEVLTSISRRVKRIYIKD